VRGLGANLTGVSVDGSMMAHANLNGNDRTFQFKQVDTQQARAAFPHLFFHQFRGLHVSRDTVPL
jgi:hypothetical protein